MIQRHWLQAICWGALLIAGCGSRGGSPQPTSPGDTSPPLGNVSTDLAAGSFHTCALLSAGSVTCWGASWDYALGIPWDDIGGTPPSEEVGLIVPISGLGGVRAITSDADHTCALVDDGTVRCWGSNSCGQLGLHDMDVHIGPVTVPTVTDVVQLDSGYASSCAVHTDGSVSCWGSVSACTQSHGAEGNPFGAQRVPDASDMVQVSVGQHQACALRQDHTVWCWNEVYAPVRTVTPAPAVENVAKIVTTRYYACAVHLDGQVTCFGNITPWESPYPPWTPRSTLETLDDVVDLCGGESHTCAVRQSGDVYCWGGQNDKGELGDGSFEPSDEPVRVYGITDAISLSCGPYHACALHDSGALSCWGWNATGQLGDGTLQNRARPRWVVVL